MAWLVFSLSFYIIFCHYACDLTSRMTVTPDSLGISSFEDVERLGYTVMVKSGTSKEEKLKNIKSLRKHLKIESSDVKLDENNKLYNLLNDKAKALFLGVSSYFTLNDGVYALDLKQPTTSLNSFGLQKDSEFTKIFSYHLRKMDESGLLHRLEKKWNHIVEKHKTDGGRRATPLGYENVLFPFMGVILGAVLALSALLCEMIAAWKHKGKPAIQEGQVGPPMAAKYYPP